MDEDLKILVGLYDEMRESCKCACKDCYVDKLKRKYNIEEMNIQWRALCITVKLLGDSQDSIDYYLNSVAKLKKACEDEIDRGCKNCKYSDSLHTPIPCYGYVIGMALLKEV